MLIFNLKDNPEICYIDNELQFDKNILGPSFGCKNIPRV